MSPQYMFCICNLFMGVSAPRKHFADRAVESYSDGPLGNSTGRLMFFLTSLDATGADVQVCK